MIISAALNFSLTGFSQNSRVKTLLEKPDTRKEVINNILNNHEYMSEFIQAMHGNQHAELMINGNVSGPTNQGQHYMHGNGQMMVNQGQMGMGGNNNMMNQNQNQNQMIGQNQMGSRSYFMDMMHNNPGMMQMMMGNMLNTVSTDSSMTSYMINSMTGIPQMIQIMWQHLNHMHMGFNSADSTYNNQIRK